MIGAVIGEYRGSVHVFILSEMYPLPAWFCSMVDGTVWRVLGLVGGRGKR